MKVLDSFGFKKVVDELSLFPPKNIEENSFKQVREKRILIICLIFCILMTVPVLIIETLKNQHLPLFATLQLSLFLLLTYYCSKKQYQPLFASFILVEANFFFNITDLLYHYRLGNHLIWCIFFIFVSVFTLPKRYSIFTSFLCVFSSIAATSYSTLQSPIEHHHSVAQFVLLPLVSMLVWALTRKFLEEEIQAFTLLERERDELKRQKDNEASLLSILRHDIATPVTIIDGITRTILRKFQANKNSVRDIETIKKSNDMIKNVIAQVRDFKLASKNQLFFVPHPTDIIDAIEQSIEVTNFRYSSKNIVFKTNYHNLRPPVLVKADTSALTLNVLCNIFSNAVKFSEPNAQVDVELSKRNNRVILKVSDHGVGIPENIMANLFDLDVSTNRLGTQSEQGTGLGMPIVKIFMDMFGAKLEVQSRTNCENSLNSSGTTFTLIFDHIPSSKQVDSPRI